MKKKLGDVAGLFIGHRDNPWAKVNSESNIAGCFSSILNYIICHNFLKV